MRGMSGAAPRIDRPLVHEPRYQPLVIVLAGVAAGIVVDRATPLPVWAWGALLGSASIAWGVLWCYGWNRAAGVTLAMALAAAGGASHHVHWQCYAANEIGRFATLEGGPVCVEVIACAAPRRMPAPPYDPMRIIPTGDRSRLEVRVIAVRDAEAWLPASGRTSLMVDGHLLGVRAGDRLRVFAQLAKVRPAANPGEFDFALHLRADRMLATLWADYPDCVSVIEPAGGFGLLRLPDRLRAAGDRLLWQHLPPERSALAAALLLGCREELSRDRTEAFVETGTIHILAISGLHVGLLMLGLSWILRAGMVSRGRSAAIIAVASVLYMLVTGANPPVIRATILVLIATAATLLGRRALAFNSLAFAGLVVLAINPADLFRVGTQLSFLAVAGMAWFLPQWLGAGEPEDPLDRLIRASMGWPERAVRAASRWLARLFLMGSVVWLLALPLVMARFHLLSPVALGLSVVLWIPLVIAMATGFAVLLLAGPIPPAGAWFGWVCAHMLGWIEGLVTLARDTPGSHFWVPGPPEWWLWGFYGGLGAAAAFPGLRLPPRWALALLAAWSAVGVAASEPVRAWFGHSDRPLECTFLSVDHGCAVVLHLPDGRTMLYDAGRLGAPLSAARSIAGYLWSRGITHIDAVVITHADADHYNALPELLRRVSVGVVYVSPVMFEDQADSQALEALDAALDAGGVEVREVFAADRLDAGGACQIEVLSPPRRGLLGGDNANSIVLAVEHRGQRVLLAGDVEGAGLDYVLAEEPWDCDVLLVPHHGSRKSSPRGLAGWCWPEHVVLSAGRRFDSRATEVTYAEAGADVYHTARHGAVRFEFDGQEVFVETFQPQRLRGEAAE